MKIFMLAASLRKDFVNRKLLNIAENIFKELKCTIDKVAYSEFNTPLYDGDLETSQGLPEGAKKFIQHMYDADATLIVSPEYNFSTPGTLKNLIDWISRDPAKPFINQHILLMSASPAMVGGNRGLWHTRVPLESCGAFVFPNMFSLALAHEAFTTDGELKDSGSHQRLKQTIESFVSYMQKQLNAGK